MKLIWTRSNLILSKLIRWGLGVDCSHFAVVFNSPAGGLMFESNLLGTHPRFYRTAQKHLEIVHEIELGISVELENKFWDRIVDHYDDKGYDYGAFFYFCWRVILHRMLNKPIPKINKWAKDDRFLCDEVYIALKEEGLVPDLNIDLAMTSPHDVFLKLQEALN